MLTHGDPALECPFTDDELECPFTDEEIEAAYFGHLLSEVVGTESPFRASYRQVARALGISYHAARDKMHRLERGGLIELADPDRLCRRPPRYRWAAVPNGTS